MPGLLRTPEAIPTKPISLPNSKNHSEWSFSFRGGCDSDTDDEDPGPSSAVNIAVNTDQSTLESQLIGVDDESEDTRLMRELDIASRANEDPAQFKATPWSIARVNAASRAPKSTPGRTTIENYSDAGGIRSGDTIGKYVLGGQGAHVRRETPGHSAADGATASTNTKTEKTIKGFFLARKLDNGGLKDKSTSASVLHSQPKTSASSRQNPPTRYSTPRNVSLQVKSTPIISTSLTQNYPTEHRKPISFTHLDTNNAQPVTLIPDDASQANNTNSPILACTSNVNEIISNSELDVTELGLLDIDSLYEDNANDLSKLPSLAPSINLLSVGSSSGSQRARSVPLVLPNSTFTPLRSINSQSRLVQGPFSSPLRSGNERFRLNSKSGASSIRQPRSIPNSASSLMSNVGVSHALSDSGIRYLGGYKQIKLPYCVQALSPPIRQPASGTQLSGRAALGLVPAKFYNPVVAESTKPTKQSETATRLASHKQCAPSHSYEQVSTPPVQTEQIQPVQVVETFEEILPEDHFAYQLPPRSPSPPRTFRSSPPRKASLTHTQTTKRQREATPQRRDAYTAFAVDEEASWSTLPVRKKARTQASSSEQSIRQSGRFKLPIALSSLAAKVVTARASAPPKRKVITYLPPPPPPSSGTNSTETRRTVKTDKIEEKEGKNSTRNTVPKNVRVSKPVSEWSIKRFGYGNSGVPTSNGGGLKFKLNSVNENSLNLGRKQSSDRGQSRNVSPHNQDDSHAMQERVEATPSDETTTMCSTDHSVNGWLSDSSNTTHKDTSDPCVPDEEGDDITVALDAEALERTYPKVREAMLERKAAASSVWDELGLSSCGVPFVDTAANIDTDTKEKHEIAIVVWDGLPEKVGVGVI